VFSLACVFVGTFVLTITEQHLMADNKYTLIDLIFEQTSAFATTGISTGITSQLTDSGKTTIILSMFIGRLGTLTIAYALSKGIVSTNYKYPEESMLIG
jgi:Trk-type K+ transport system membrane component